MISVEERKRDCNREIGYSLIMRLAGEDLTRSKVTLFSFFVGNFSSYRLAGLSVCFAPLPVEVFLFVIRICFISH